MSVAKSAGYSESRFRRASLYRWLRRLHLWLSLAAAVPIILLSLTGALLVYGHELEALVLPAVDPIVPNGKPLSYRAILDHVAQQKPEVTVWSLTPARIDDQPWRLWLGGGAGVLDIDPYTGRVLRQYKPSESPYGIVKALHRRWLVPGKPWAEWARNATSAISLALMVQVVIGIWLWGLPSKRLRRLQPDFRHSGRLAIQRLHMSCGVVVSAILLLIAFTGIAMWWHESIEPIVETVTASRVEKPTDPVADGLAPLADLDTAINLALAAVPDSTIAHFRAPKVTGEPLMLNLHTPDTHVVSRVWVGDDPPRVLQLYDGRQATAATWFWQMRYWLHLGDFAGWPVRLLWLIVALTPTGFVLSGLWLWRDRHRPRTARQAG